MHYKEFYKHLLKENAAVPQPWNTNIDVVFNGQEKDVLFILNNITKDLWLEEKKALPKLIAEIKSKPDEYGRLEDYEYISKKLKPEIEQGNGEEFYDDLPEHPRGLGKTSGVEYLSPSDGKDIKEGEPTFSLTTNQPKGRLTKEVALEIEKLLKTLNKPLGRSDDY